MKEKEVILVNEKDEEIGRMNKFEAHNKGLLHRAFSIFILNRKGEMLLQKRADSKYHNGGMWTNTCCSHPGPGEEIMKSALKRLKEEMGFQVPLIKLFEFTYRAEFQNGLIEHELDHVFVGEYNGLITVDKHEISDYCFKDIIEIKDSLKSHPHKFTIWFQLAFPKIEKWWASTYPLLSPRN